MWSAKKNGGSAGDGETPMQIEVWDDLPRSKAGKVLKPDIRARLAGRSGS